MNNQPDYEQLFLNLGIGIIDGTKKNSTSGRKMLFFNSWFGVSAFICAEVWRMLFIKSSFDALAQPKHLLWTLFFLKTYNFETTMSGILKADCKTLRKWIKYMLSEIANLHDQVIVFENRHAGNTQFKCKLTIDGTDFEIQEPQKFDKKWYSVKFKGPGLRYEVGVCIFNGHIVWINGPFPCGSFPDISIFRSDLKYKLMIGERVEADKGYLGEPLYISTPDDYIDENHRIYKNHARARQEHLNGRFKMFEILRQIYRHEINMHSDVFFSVATLVQLGLMHNDKRVWEVNYAGEIFTGLPLPI